MNQNGDYLIDLILAGKGVVGVKSVIKRWTVCN